MIYDGRHFIKLHEEGKLDKLSVKELDEMIMSLNHKDYWTPSDYTGMNLISDVLKKKREESCKNG